MILTINNIKMKKVLYIMILFLAGLYSSCSDMNDLHNPYLERGETVYAAKVDSVGVKPGNMRLMLDVFMKAQRVTHGIVYWNNNQDSLKFDFDVETGKPKELLLSNMDEKNHIFTFITFDKDNNKSLPFEVVGNVYGPDYEGALLNRVIDRISEEDAGIVIYWKDSGESLGVRLKYTNNENVEKVINVSSTDETTLITDAVQGADFTYITFYKPEENSMDIFEAKEKIQNFPFPNLDRTGWIVKDVTSEESVGEGAGNGVASCVLDGNYETFWHSQWKDGNHPLPHSFVIDMKEIYEVGGIEVARRSGNNVDTRKLKIDISENGIDFATVGEIDYGDSNNNARDKTVLFQAIQARYVKIWVTESNNSANASIAEIFIKGREIE